MSTAVAPARPTQRASMPGALSIRSKAGTAGVLAGTPIVFDSWTKLAEGVMERLAPGSCDLALAAAPDLPLVFGHDMNAPLARRGRNMSVFADARGVHFRAELPDTSLGRDLAELVRVGIIAGGSFAFTIAREASQERDGALWFSILEVGYLRELTVCVDPAYPATSMQLVEARARARGDDPARLRRLVRASTPAPKEAKMRTAPASVPAPRSGLRVVEPPPYGPQARHSYFADRLLLADEDRTPALRRALAAAPPRGAAVLGPTYEAPATMDGRPPWLSGWSAEAARARLAAAAAETRAVGTGTNFAPPAGFPGFLAERFAISARAAASVVNVFTVEPMPRPAVIDDHGTIVVSAPRLAGSATTAIQTEQAAASSTDPTTALATSPTATVAGLVTVSQQLLDLSGGPGGPGSIDTAIAAELGAAFAADRDAQLLSGTGVAPQTLGLRSVTGATTFTYTDASPTPAKANQALAKLASLTATARGRMPNVALMHPRRWAWFCGEADTATRPLVPPDPAETDQELLAPGGPVGVVGPGLRVYVSPLVPTTLGAGTEDTVIVACREDLLAFAEGPMSRVADAGALVGTLQAQVMVYGYLAALPQRWPSGVGIATGSGFAAPAGY